MSFIGGADHSAITYFKVLHSGGLVVRSEPNLTSPSTGRVISCDSIVTTRKNLWKDGENFFIEVSEGGWVVVKRGALNACARISGPDIKTGEWSYEVIHPSGSRFAKSPNISEASDRYDKIYQKGTVIKAIRKRTDIGSVITMVQLEGDSGWIFEHASTGQVLDRLGNELVVVPIDGNRELRDLTAQVVNIDGVNILTTPTETSIWKGRLEKDKVIQCCEVLTVPLHMVESESDGAGTCGGATTVVGTTQYFRLKDKRGWVVAMRRSKEWNMPQGKKPAVFVVDVAEITAPSSAPSSSSSSSSSQADPTHSHNHNHNNNHGAAEQGRSRDSPVPTTTAAAAAAGTHASVSSPTRTALSIRTDQGVSEPPLEGASVTDNKMVEKSGDSKLAGEVVEDAPHTAWYRIIYKGGIRLRRSCSMHDTLEGTLPVGCFVKTCRRVVKKSRTEPKVEGTVSSDKDKEKEKAKERDKDGQSDADAERGAEREGGSEGDAASQIVCSDKEKESRQGGDTAVYLQLLACVGAKVRVADAWIFEMITHSASDKKIENSVVIAAEKVEEPKVESQPGLVLMVLYPGGITLRASPHMSAAKVDYIVKMYECHSAQGMISTADGMESFALLGGGAWLPCKAPGGLEVAVRVPRMPFSREGFFEVTMRKDCQTLYGPFPDTPLLPHVLPNGIVLQFDVLMWYPSSDGSVSASDIFLRLQQSESDVPAPAIWVRRDDEVLSIVERTPSA